MTFDLIDLTLLEEKTIREAAQHDPLLGIQKYIEILGIKRCRILSQDEEQAWEADKHDLISAAYDEGYELGQQLGYEHGYDIGHREGHDEGVEIGYQEGYNDGNSRLRWV